MKAWLKDEQEEEKAYWGFTADEFLGGHFDREAFAARLDRAIQREQKRRDGDDVDQSTDEFTQHECGVEQHETSAGTAGAGWCRRSADRRGWPERQGGSESQGCHPAASKKEQLPKNEVARVVKKCNPECQR